MCLWKAIFASLPFVDRYQRFSKEWNQVARIRSVKAKTFKEAADVLGTSPSTIIRRFKELIKTMPNGVQLPEVIVIDILPNRRKETIHHYLAQYGLNVKMVVMDMNPAFKAKKNGIPIIVKN